MTKEKKKSSKQETVYPSIKSCGLARRVNLPHGISQGEERESGREEMNNKWRRK